MRMVRIPFHLPNETKANEMNKRGRHTDTHRHMIGRRSVRWNDTERLDGWGGLDR
jgi:hypothetical protein